MRKAVKGQRDLIDFAETQHQDIEAELRARIADLEREVAGLQAEPADARDERIATLLADLEASNDERELLENAEDNYIDCIQELAETMRRGVRLMNALSAPGGLDLERSQWLRAADLALHHADLETEPA